MRGPPLAGLSRFGAGVKANVYVDGFNLYYGLKSHARRATTSRDAAYKWLDLAALCGRVLPGDTINRVRYFTAQIQVRGDPWKAQRQRTYLRALQTIPNLTVHYGRFLSSWSSTVWASLTPGLA